MGAFGLHRPWINRVDPDLLRPQLFREHVRHRVYGALGRRVDRRRRRCQPACVRADVDDAFPLGAEVFRRLLCRQNEPQDICVKLAMKLLFRDVLERRKLVDSSVVHQHVQASKLLLCLRKNPLHIGRLRHIPLYRDRFAALARDFSDHAIGAFLAGGIVHHHRRALRRQTLRNACANAL